MKHGKLALTLGVILIASTTLLQSTVFAGGSAKTQQYATAASLGEAALLYNYARKQNSTNGALALAGAGGTAYLWNQYSGQRRREDRDAAARRDYYRNRAAYYHKLAIDQHKKLAYYHRMALAKNRKTQYYHTTH